MKHSVLLVIPYFGNRSAKGIYTVLRRQAGISVSVLNIGEKDDAPAPPYIPADCYFPEGLGLADRVRALVADKDVELILPTKDA